MKDFTKTVRECIEEISRAELALEKANYHLRLAIELTMQQRELLGGENIINQILSSTGSPTAKSS